MKKLVSILLVLCVCVAVTTPVAAAGGYGTVMISDGAMTVAFSQAKTETKTIMLSRQGWSAENATLTQTAAERKEVSLIVVGADCTVTRSGGNGAMTTAFVARSGSNYVVAADRLALYETSFSVQTLLSYPFVKAEMALLTLGDGQEYFIVSEMTAVTEAPPLPISYVVQPGDSEERIALNYYGVQGLGEALKAANPEHYAATNGILEAGRALTLPTTLNGVTLRKAPLLGAGEQFYTIKSGDMLTSIALKYYGDPAAYTKIVERNGIKDPAGLRIGDLLILPAK